MNWRLVILLVACVVTVTVAAQENVQLKVNPVKGSKEQPTLSVPVKPTGLFSTITPVTPSFESPKLDINPHDLIDSLAVYNAYMNLAGTLAPNEKPQYDFSRDPYSRNWSRSGVIAMAGGGYLVGSGSYEAMPALGNIGTASLTWVQPLGDRLTVSAGLTGNKYHFDRSIWNSYGAFANARFRLSNHFAIKAWGSYYANTQFHSMAAMPYMGISNYGASVEMMATDNVGLNLGAQRYYDPFSRRWHTVPVIAPIINVLGQPLSIDFGGLLGNLFESWSSKSKYNEPIDPMKSYDPKCGTNFNSSLPVAPVPPGFNPHSPVRIPDALRK